MLARAYAYALHKAAHAASPARQEELAAHLLSLLKRQGHLALLPTIVREYQKLFAQSDSARKGVLTLARRKDETLFSTRVEQVCHELGLCTERLEVREDPTLIGGFVVHAPGVRYDASYRRALTDLYRQFTNA